MSFKSTQLEEARTWLDGDADKKQRETIRYPLIAKQMGLNYLDTSNMVVYDVGAGPFGGVSSILRCKRVLRIEPLKNEYAKIADVTTYSDVQAEKVDYKEADLVISTNAIDHFESPQRFFEQLVKTMKPGGYFAHFHAIDNAFSHPHHAHEHNVNPEMVRTYLQNDYELCWELDYLNDGLTYGWHKYGDKVGQPAFTQLWRKTTGYGKR